MAHNRWRNKKKKKGSPGIAGAGGAGEAVTFFVGAVETGVAV